jgi:peptidoglycan/LPS O-acetylase OafA/YrhL
VLALTLVQLIAVVTAGLALLLGGWMLVVARRPWRKEDEDSPPPRIRLLGLSYILVFGSAMVQVVLQARGDAALGLGALMVTGGVIVIAVVGMEARARRQAELSDAAVHRIRKVRSESRPV